ncbi:MAG: DnaJ domain-containing protein [Syntrophales bacterium]|nr:DnaJ domain-containing protein [Syntrophales bacterium]
MIEQQIVRKTKEKKVYRCLSCGTTENMGRRKYCSPECRQKLRFKLQARVGLVQALNTRYATFYFSDEMIIMDILPYGSNEIFSFLYPRSQGKKPAEDFSKLANILGNLWWEEKKKTNKRYMASKKVLSCAQKKPGAIEEVRPQFYSILTLKKQALAELKIEKHQIKFPELKNIIKNAYRKQVKAHHPDMGGDAERFRKIQQAYENLMRWVENPKIKLRRGFPDKWFYDGEKNRWIQPLSL